MLAIAIIADGTPGLALSSPRFPCIQPVGTTPRSSRKPIAGYPQALFNLDFWVNLLRISIIFKDGTGVGYKSHDYDFSRMMNSSSA
jgi:hypothetical protein